MHADQALNTFHLHDHALRNYDVWPVLANLPAFVHNGYTWLSHERQSAVGQLDTKRFLVRALRHPRPKHPMHLNCTADDLLGEGVVNVHTCLNTSVPRCV